MIRNLLHKEFSLCVSGQAVVFLCMAPLMMLIPNYPRYVPFFYVTIPILLLFSLSTMNNDALYTGCLPVKKSDVIKARFLLIGFIELAEMIVCVPFGIAANFLLPGGNNAGINSTVAFYGLQLVEFALFNFVFLVPYYKKADKPGWSFLAASIVYWVLYALLELPVWLKTSFGMFITSLAPGDQVKQLPILAGGMVFWCAMTYLTFRLCAKRFETVNL
jgi:hypothetical protein